MGQQLDFAFVEGAGGSAVSFLQTALTLAAMPLANAAVRANLTIRNYPFGHMVYLDSLSRTAMKTDLSLFSASATTQHVYKIELAKRLQFCRPYIKFPAAEHVLRPRATLVETWRVPDLFRAYDWPIGLAGGGTIAIIDLGGG